MPRLILLNGPPGCGKSTLAEMFVHHHPLALNLDIDRVRGLLGRWQDNPTEAGLSARAMAIAMARTHLRAGHDVVIPQYLGRLAFIQELEQVAAAAPAEFFELVLLDSKDNSLRRFVTRGRASSTPAHAEASEPALGEMYDRLLDVVSRRPRVRIVESEDGRAAATYQRLLAALVDPAP